MFNKLLVPLDRSALAEQAIPRAASIARACHAAIDLVLVHEPFPPPGQPESPFSGEAWFNEEKYLDGIAKELIAGAGLDVTSAMLRGLPADMIRERAKQSAADLIVMTSHGRTGFSRAWLGSVADGVVRHSSVPVLIVRPVERVEATRAVPAPFKRILVPLDGSSRSADILPTATMLARTSSAALTLLTVLEEGTPAGTVTEALLDLQQTALRLFESESVAANADVMLSNRAADTIIAFARALEADVVAMSTHGRGASRLLLGSVADKVLRGSHSAVLLHHPSAATFGGRLITAESVAEQLPAITGTE
jgi:nucleotide-binding universal stress UspA family protein